MKKSTVTFFMLCLACIALLASCKKEVKPDEPDEPETPVTPVNTKPSLSIINQEGYIANGDTLQCGTSYNFGFIARSNSQTNAELSSLIILIDNEERANLELSGTEYIYNDSISFPNDYPNNRVTITAILSDTGGKEVSQSLQVQLQKIIIEGKPSIAVIVADNFITGTIENPTIIDYNDENAINLKYGFHVESNAESMKELSSLKLTWDYTFYENGEETYTYDTASIDLSGMTSYDFSNYLFEQREIITLMDGTITAVVTDVDNQTDTAVIAFTIQIEEVPLHLMSSTIEWVRRGSIALNEEEMASYGLKWTGSYKEVFATIEPLNEDVILYLCNGDDFENINFVNEKYAYFSNLAETAEPILKYRNISSQNSYDYNDMLAVIYGDELNLILIKRADIEVGTYGTQVTISGEAK
jgi:hypothetical protein